MHQKNLRLKLLDVVKKSNSSHCHLGSCLSCIDIIGYLHLFEMKPHDKFVLSKGHAALALFVVLNHQKKISDKQLSTYLQNGTHLGIHTPSSMPNIIPLATGSLGHGLSFSCGVAYGYRLLKTKIPQRVFCLLSDGECNEGAVWEGALFASRHQLSNLIVLIDKNNLQAFGKTLDVLGEAASTQKWHAFGFNTYMCDGHNTTALKKTLQKINRTQNNKPHVIICNTSRGKGIKDIENKVISNYTKLTDELFTQALTSLK